MALMRFFNTVSQDWEALDSKSAFQLNGQSASEFQNYKDIVYSGVLNLSEYTFEAENKVKFNEKQEFIINGWKGYIPADTEFALPQPPVFGERTDLTAIIGYVNTDDERASLNIEILTVEGVKTLEDAGYVKDSEDVGLWKKADATKRDGFVYAIPLFKVARRNSNGYREDNLNGAHPYKEFTLTSTGVELISGSFGQSSGFLTPGSVAKYFFVNADPDAPKLLDVGRPLERVRLTSTGIIKAITTDYIIVEGTSISSGLIGTNNRFVSSTTPDGRHADVIHKDDIIDLRHKVSLTGFDKNYLLQKEFDAYMRGERGNKELNKETFNLVPAPKNVEPQLMPVKVTGNDGVERYLVNLLGTDGNFETDMFHPNYYDATTSKYGGRSVKYDYGWNVRFNYSDYKMEAGKKYLILVDTKTNGSRQSRLNIQGDSSGSFSAYLQSKDWATMYAALDLVDDTGKFYLLLGDSTPPEGTYAWFDGLRVYEIDQETYDKIDVLPEFTGEELAKKFPYVDSVSSVVENLIPTSPNHWRQGLRNSNGNFQGWDNGITLNEFLNVGSNQTYTLSAKASSRSSTTRVMVREYDSSGNFIDGSDSNWITSQHTFTTRSNTAMIHVNLSTSGGMHPMNVNDLDVVEIQLVKGSQPNSVYVPYGRWYLPHDYGTGRTKHYITETLNEQRSIMSDAQTSETRTDKIEVLRTPQKHIEVTQAEEGTWAVGDTIKVRSDYGVIDEDEPTVTADGIEGTWEGLGTKEATYTITTAPTDDKADILVEYTVNYPAGKGIEYLPSEVLEAEVNGQKLTEQGNTVTVVADFKGKTVVSSDANPHRHHGTGSVSNENLRSPYSESWEEPYQDSINSIKELDGNVRSNLATGEGYKAQQLFSFNIIRAIEDKYGEGAFADCPTTEMKVAKLKGNAPFSKPLVSRLLANWWGMGSGPNGSKATLSRWHSTAGNWTAYSSTSTSNDSITKLSLDNVTTISNIIDSEGKVHLLAHAEPSDGTTASRIETDYVNLEIELNVAEEGYTVLQPVDKMPVLSDDPLLHKQGENLIPPFTDPRWSLGSQMIAEDDYTLFVDNPTVVRESFLHIPVSLGSTYISSISSQIYSGLTARVYKTKITSHDASKIVSNLYNGEKFTVDSSYEGFVTVRLASASGTGYFTKPKLELGSKATPFTPSKIVNKRRTLLDFRGKIAGSEWENPHRFGRRASTSLLPSPASFEETGSSSYYADISEKDGVLNAITTSGVGNYAQMAFEFDLSHLGLSLSELKKALRMMTVSWTGYGSGSSDGVKTFGVEVKWWEDGRSGGARWSPSETKRRNTSSEPSTVSYNHSSLTTSDNIGTLITNDQKVYILAHTTHPADGTIPSEIFTDYISLEVELADYVDHVKTNILLVKPETKEIKTAFPVKSYRTGVQDQIKLWYNHVPVIQEISGTQNVTILAESDSIILTDLSTASGDKQGQHPWNNLLYKIGNNKADLLGDLGYANLSWAIESKGINIGRKVSINKNGFVEGYVKQYGLSTISRPMVGIARYLVLHEGEIKLLVMSNYSNAGSIEFGNSSNTVAKLVVINGNPLTKEQEGFASETIANPTAWRTPEEQARGLLDASGNLNVTYQ